MPYTTSQLQALQNALASGELRVRFGDREVEYRSVEEGIDRRCLVSWWATQEGINSLIWINYRHHLRSARPGWVALM